MTGLARRTDPETSHEAAARVNATALELEVLGVIATHGPPRGLPMCTVEMHRYLQQHPIDAISPRPSKLVAKGFAKCLGKAPRANRYGKTRNQFVYEVTEKGLKQL